MMPATGIIDSISSPGSLTPKTAGAKWSGLARVGLQASGFDAGYGADLVIV